MISWLRSSVIHRSLPNDRGLIYLTFDDGPDVQLTEKVNQLLTEKNCPATFFVIVNKAKENVAQIQKLQSQGHRIFSHSSDHGYRSFFSSKRKLKSWVLDSVDEIQQITGKACWGFRPPAGVLTPLLVEIAEEESMPLYLWNHRFFDTQKAWSAKAAMESIQQMSTGDIVLLHDRQKEKNKELFLQTLHFYIHNIEAKDLRPAVIE